MISRKTNSIFLILPFLFLFFLLPLFLITKRSLHPPSSLTFFPPSSQSQFIIDLKHHVSNATLHPTPLHKTNKGDTFLDKNDTFFDKNDNFFDKGGTFVDNGGVSDNSDGFNAGNHPNPGHKTSKGGTFGDEGGLSDNSIVEIKDEDSNERNDPNHDHKTSKDESFGEKGEALGDKGGVSENVDSEIKHDVSKAMIHTNTDQKFNEGDAFVGKNGDGIGSSEVSGVVLGSFNGSGAGRIEDGRGEKEAELLRRCNLYEGKWVKDEEGKNYPIYKPGACPYVDEAYDCQTNGRMDSEYLKWQWKPDECELPRFSSASFLERLRGKTLMLVGDSMNRNQFESLLCMLWEGLPDKSKMYEIHGYKITKGRGYFVFKFEDYDCRVEFVRSHFLVREGVRRNGQGHTNPTLSIDTIDKSARKWRQADILVFNTGHWWTHGKTARGKNYYKEGDTIYPSFDAVEAYSRAMKTWAKWIDAHISPKKLVIYRGYSSAHFRGGDWDSGGSCKGEEEPVLSGAILDSYPPKMKIVDEVIKDMKSPVVLLNVTKLTNFRKDGHPSVYGKALRGGKRVPTRRQDCSHWCLPGVPDAWNELVFAAMVLHQTSTAA